MLLFLLFFLALCTPVLSVVEDCGTSIDDGCTEQMKAFPHKIIAIVTILISSIIGVSLPLLTGSIPAMSPGRSLFVIVKAFTSGIILGTGFMHVLPDSIDMLSSSCMKENPWHKFSFTGFVAMLSAIITLMVDSLATIMYCKKNKGGIMRPDVDTEMAVVQDAGHAHGHTTMGPS